MAFRSFCCVLLLRILTTTAGQQPVRTSSAVEVPPTPLPPAAARRRLRAIDEMDVASAYAAAAAAASSLGSRADEYAAGAAPDGYYYWPSPREAASVPRSWLNAQQRVSPPIAAAQTLRTAAQAESDYDIGTKSSGAEVESDSRSDRRQSEDSLPRLLLKLIRPAGGLGTAPLAPKRALLGATNTRAAAALSSNASSAGRRGCATSERRCQSLCSQRSPLLTSWVMILSGC